MQAFTSWAIALSVAVSAVPAVAAGDGWSVRICRGYTEAAAIKISVGEEGGKNKQVLVNWQSDVVKTDFALPASLANAPKVWVEADSEPPDGQVSLCVLYKGTPAKGMAFNDIDVATVAQGDKDPKCQCPTAP